jgi:predicted deacetylase
VRRRGADPGCLTSGALAGGTPATPRIAVAVHDIEPATFQRCALIRDWLDDHGVDRATLLVIPARDLHPLGERSPEVGRWLADRRSRGDSIAQHGFQHGPPIGGLARRALPRFGARGPEFSRLDHDETRRALGAGWRVLKLAGIEPDGFVAPSYAYTEALRRLLASKFRWWAGMWRVHGPRTAPDSRSPLAPALGVGTHGPLERALSPLLIRAGGLLCGELLRVDLYPSDLEHPRQMMALERVLARNGRRRRAVTYEELVGRTAETRAGQRSAGLVVRAQPRL